MALRRLLAALGLAASGLLLTGCHVDGTVDITSTKQATLDLILSDYTNECVSEEGAPILLEPVVDFGGVTRCHLTGVMDLTEGLGLDQFTFTEVGDHLVLGLSLPAEHAGLPEGTLTLRFAGEVEAASEGRVAGNQVTIENLAALKSPFSVVARNRPGPSPTLLAGLAGMGAGVGGTLLVVATAWALRRRPRARALPDEAERPGPDDALGLSGTVPVAQGDASASEEPGRAAPPDHSWFARPPEHAPPGPAASPASPDTPADHSVWAPPTAP